MTSTEPSSPRDGGTAEPDRARCLIVGLGNPYCGNDAIGLVVARQVHDRIGGLLHAELAELSSSAFDVADRIAGYQRVILIDALIDDEAAIGCVKRIALAECGGRTSLGLHTTGLADALELARLGGMAVPPEVVVYGICIRQPLEFSEELSLGLQAKLPEIVGQICDEAGLAG